MCRCRRRARDHAIARAENIQIVNVAPEGVWNARAVSLAGSVNSVGLTFEGKALSYGREIETAAGLYVDGTLVSAQMVSLPADTETTVVWRVPGVFEYASARMVLETEDAFPEDNAFTCFRQGFQTAKIALASQHPFYFEQAFTAFRGLRCTVFSRAWEMPTSGYDIYVFDGCLPEVQPTDGAVWIVNPPENTAILSGLKTEGTVNGGVITRTNEKTEDVRAAVLLSDLANRDTAVKRLRFVSTSSAWKTLLTVNRAPALLAGYIEGELPFLMLTFDLHQSNLPLQTDFLVLIRNMVRFSVPPMLENLSYAVGEALEIARLPLSLGAEVKDEDQQSYKLSLSGTAYNFTADRPGVYTAEQKTQTGRSVTQSFQITVPGVESDVSAKDNTVLYLARLEGGGAEENQGMPLTVPLALLLLILLILECVVYHRERI